MVLTVPVQVWTRSLHHETVAVHAHARCFCGNQKHQNRFLWACSPCTLTCQLYRFINSSFVLTVLSLNFSIAHDRRMGVKGCFFTYVIKYIYHVHEDLLLSYFLSSTPLFHFSTSFIFAFAVSLFTPHPHPLIACSLYLTINLSPLPSVYSSDEDDDDVEIYDHDYDGPHAKTGKRHLGKTRWTREEVC